MAYGIDCLLTPPSLGGRCDTQKTVDFPVSVTAGSASNNSCGHLTVLLSRGRWPVLCAPPLRLAVPKAPNRRCDLIGRLLPAAGRDLILSLCFCRQEVQNCDLPSIYVTRNSGCLSICTVTVWQPQCCRGYYGRDCLGENVLRVCQRPIYGGRKC